VGAAAVGNGALVTGAAFVGNGAVVGGCAVGAAWVLHAAIIAASSKSVGFFIKSSLTLLPAFEN
jgi:hypothetical protein